VTGREWGASAPYGQLTRAVKVLLITLGVAFVIQVLGDRITGGYVTALLGLSLPGIRHGFLWQFVTYIFLHGGIFHLLLNGMFLYFLGPSTEEAIGTRQFYILFFLTGILGGLGWLLISPSSGAVCIGASGAIFGVIGAFAALFPHRRITLLLFFILPLTMEAWVMALVFAGVELTFLISSGGGGGIANAAHLAGGIAGYFYTLMVFRRGFNLRDTFSRYAKTRSWKVLDGGHGTPGNDEVDRVLDKIATSGMSSLSAREREVLERASRERKFR